MLVTIEMHRHSLVKRVCCVRVELQHTCVAIELGYDYGKDSSDYVLFFVCVFIWNVTL